jgi:ParB family transcriptional regulator, chromosome partitioning protein
MSAPKRNALGRGLAALIPGAPSPSAPATTGIASRRPSDGTRTIAVEEIHPSPGQPRTRFDDTRLDELAASIKTQGIIQPLIVRARVDGGYELIAGERRWRAAVAAGLTTIPALLRTADDKQSLEIAIIENLQRENLDPLEEAMGFAHLMEAYEFTQDAVAQRVGRSRPAIANALRLLGLSDTIKALLREGRLSAGAARALLAIPEARRDVAARRAVDEGLTVRALEALARDPVVKAPVAVKPLDAETAAVVDRLRFRLATHIALVRRERGGSIEIRFSDETELMRLIDLLLGDSP